MKFRRSELTDSIVRYLREFPQDTVISYEDLSTHVDSPIVSTTHQLRQAKRILQREDGQIWWAERLIGIRRLNNSQMAEKLGSFFVPGARRKLRRGGTVADNVQNRELSLDEQARFAARAIQIELGLSALSRAQTARLEKICRGRSNDLPSFNAVEWAIRLSPRYPAD